MKVVVGQKIFIRSIFSKRLVSRRRHDVTQRRMFYAKLHKNATFRIQSVYAAFLSNSRGCSAARQVKITYVIRVAWCKSRETIVIDRRFTRQSSACLCWVLFIHDQRENSAAFVCHAFGASMPSDIPRRQFDGERHRLKRNSDFAYHVI